MGMKGAIQSGSLLDPVEKNPQTSVEIRGTPKK